MINRADNPKRPPARKYLTREEIRRRLDAWEAADPQYFARLKKRYGKPKTK